MRSVSFSVVLSSLVVSACSSDLPSTRTVDLTDANGDPVVDGTGSVVKIREVKTPEGEWVPCDSDDGARMLVRDSEGKLQYAGQALMNQTCARGQCHASSAEGELRTGAPAGMDFDLPLVPLVEDPTTGQLGPDQQVLTLLNVHQRRVYDWRSRIWEQVDQGHMPPDGAGEGFRGDPGLTAVTLDESLACTDGEKIEAITESATRWKLGAWLACGSPLVEASDTAVTEITASEVGRIMPACGAVEPPPEGVSFEQVYDEVLSPMCKVCHLAGGTNQDVLYDDLDTAYANMVGKAVVGTSGDTCGGPTMMAVPNDPEGSYILHKMQDPELAAPMHCGLLMPYGAAQPLTAGTALIRAWIESGAPGPGESPGGGGDSADAGVGADGGP